MMSFATRIHPTTTQRQLAKTCSGSTPSPSHPTEIYGVYAEALVRREGLLAHTGRIKATRGGMTLTGPDYERGPDLSGRAP